MLSSMHVPLNPEALRDAMPTFIDLLREDGGWANSEGSGDSLPCLASRDEAAFLVEIDEAGAGGPVGVAEGDWALKDVIVLGDVLGGWIWTRDFEQVAQFGEEEDVVGAFGGGGVLPTCNEWGG